MNEGIWFIKTFLSVYVDCVLKFTFWKNIINSNKCKYENVIFFWFIEGNLIEMREKNVIYFFSLRWYAIIHTHSLNLLKFLSNVQISKRNVNLIGVCCVRENETNIEKYKIYNQKGIFF